MRLERKAPLSWAVGWISAFIIMPTLVGICIADWDPKDPPPDCSECESDVDVVSSCFNCTGHEFHCTVIEDGLCLPEYIGSTKCAWLVTRTCSPSECCDLFDFPNMQLMCEYDGIVGSCRCVNIITGGVQSLPDCI
jgi:hypothetical protein